MYLECAIFYVRSIDYKKTLYHKVISLIKKLTRLEKALFLYFHFNAVNFKRSTASEHFCEGGVTLYLKTLKILSIALTAAEKNKLS